MRVLIVNTFYYPNMQGGAEQSVKLLAENLLRHGNTVAIYCADAKEGQKDSRRNQWHYSLSLHNREV